MNYAIALYYAETRRGRAENTSSIGDGSFFQPVLSSSCQPRKNLFCGRQLWFGKNILYKDRRANQLSCRRGFYSEIDGENNRKGIADK